MTDDLRTRLARYAPIVDDLDAFLDAAVRPLPPVVWANPLRASPAEVAALIAERAPQATPVPWLDDAWRLPVDARPGKWPEFEYGWLHTQEEASIWPATLLDARPGERVLDLCAAPGGKTARIACAMADRGTLVANDMKFGRLASLRRTLDRLGVTCAVVTCTDGLRLPRDAGPFDRVLVDAPCTCEGTSRKSRGRRDATDDGQHAFISPFQRGLLRRAVALTRPGGVIVYSTCTYAPEENEMVLDAVSPDLAVVEPLTPFDGLRAAPGVTTWQGQPLRPDAVHAARLWPHHADTGGFFVARLRRL